MNKHDAIYDCYPQVGYIRDNDAFDRDGNPVLYDEALVLAYMEKHSYIEKRKREYPSFGDQFDTIFHEGIDAWKTKIQDIKNKYPKP